jgi:hypothetical protein
MASYSFDQRCRPCGDFRIDEMIEFFALMKEAFRFPELYDQHSKPVPLQSSVLQSIFSKSLSKVFPSVGSEVAFFSIPPRSRDDKTVRFDMHAGTGSDENVIDQFNIEIGERSRVPDLSYFERSIEIFHPFEAYLSEDNNEFDLNSYDREQAQPGFTKPVIIRGFHYLDKTLAQALGGIAYCLKTPAWHVERFCDGVLIELFPGPLDNTNPEHLRIQEEAMAYFGLL